MSETHPGRLPAVPAHVIALCVLLLAVVPGGRSWAEPERCLGQRATIVGTNGTERLEGTNRDDVISARGGSDYVLGKGGDDLICGGPGDDHLLAGLGRDRMTGVRGDDSLVGGHGTQLLDGGDGSDTFFPSGGVGGRMRGGGGNDWIVFSDRKCARGVVVDLADRRVTYPGCKQGWSRGDWTVRAVERVEGSRGGDVLVGTRRSNQILGQEGRDRLRGLAGKDRLDGGSGRDRGAGGPGIDRCYSIEVRRSC